MSRRRRRVIPVLSVTLWSVALAFASIFANDAVISAAFLPASPTFHRSATAPSSSRSKIDRGGGNKYFGSPLTGGCSLYLFSPEPKPEKGKKPVPAVSKNTGEYLESLSSSAARDDGGGDDDVVLKPSNRDQAVESDEATFRVPVFDFADLNTVDSFDRIDDAVMGGISTSALRDIPDKPYASWSGVCRLDGGGFCGMRTLPFEKPLHVGDANGIYVDCRLASDDEPERRVWKITARTQPGRGEVVHQAMFKLPKRGSAAVDEDGWTRVEVPFTDFKLVRGPRLVKDGQAFNTTKGIYQIGMTMSKFVMAENTTEIENFRPGFFELQLKRIGFYKDKGTSKIEESVRVEIPKTLTKEEAEKKRPILLKLLLPVGRLFFSEKSNRRRSAMNILTNKRGMSRGKAILYGMKMRAGSYGMPTSIAQILAIISVDCARTIARFLIRVCLIYPLVALQRSVLFFNKNILKKAKEMPSLE